MRNNLSFPLDDSPPPKANILLVDDHPANLLALEAVLDDPGHNLVKARSGEEALDLVLDQDFAVILLDVRMPGLDGFETANRIRSRERSRHTPFIFLTAHDDDGPSLLQAYSLGAVDYLVKPLLPVILRAKVTGFVDLFQKTEQIKRQAEQLRELQRREFERKLAEENTRLYEQREWLRVALASIGDAVIATDPEGRVIFMNAVAQSLTGWKQNQAEGRALEEVFTIIEEETRKPAENPVARVLREGTVVGLANHTILVSRDGTAAAIEDSAAPIRDEEGKIFGVILVFHDVTQRKRGEAELRRKQQELVDFVENATVGLHWVGPDGRILWANQAELDLVGYAREEYIGHHLTEFHADQLLIEDLLRRLANKEVVANCEARLRCKDGSIRHVLINSNVLWENDKFIHTQCFTRDITDRIQAEEAVRSLLRISGRLNSSLDVDTLLDILVQEAIQLVNAESGVAGLCTSEGMVCQKYFQQETPRPFEYTWPPLVGLPGWVLVHKVPYLTNEAQADTQIVQKLCEQFGVQSALATPILNAKKEVLGFFELHNKKDRCGFTQADQEKLVAVSQVAAIAIENALAYRKVRQAEEALKLADRRKDDFLAMLAHELRNPLGPIRNAAQIIGMLVPADANGQRARDMIERQVQHLTRMVDDLLDVSRLTKNKMNLQKERLDLAWLVAVAVEDCRPFFEQAGLHVRVERPEVPVWVEGDLTRITQIIDNLLQNARKFTERGGQVDIQVEADEEWAAVRVRDTGVGIDPDVLSGLFQAFAQADRSLDRSKGGLGLGLALVKGLVDLHGGEVSASSSGPGLGAEFVVKLPRQAEPEAVKKMPTEPCRPAKRLRILVVEDNTDAAESLRVLLGFFGYEVAVAHSGPAGVEAARAWKPEIVLCDIGLPGMNGYEVVAELRRHPATATARVIAITGYGREEDRRRSAEAGFDQHLVKPVDPEALQELLACS